MALQSPFFNKREPDTYNNTRTGSTAGSGAMYNPSGSVGAAVNGATANTTAGSAGAGTASANTGAREGESKLTVGPNIKLKGVEITDCDTLVVEGTVEATMDSRVIQITEQGAFRGTAEIDIAEIHGEFDGSLTVREKLVIFSTGKVTGKIRYGKVVIEEGGQLSGEISVGVGGARAPAASTSAVTSSTSSAASSSTLAAA